MARLLKQGGRKPVIEAGGVYCGFRWDDVRRAPLYEVTVGGGSGVAHTLQLQEWEMLEVVKEWLVRHARDVRFVADAAEKARAAGAKP